MQRFLSIIIFCISFSFSGFTQEVDILFHVLELTPPSNQQSGYIDIALPTYTSDNQKVIYYAFSELPSGIIHTDQKFAARWTAKELTGVSILQIQAVIVTDQEKPINYSKKTISWSTGSHIKSEFQKTKFWEEINKIDIIGKYRYLPKDDLKLIQVSSSNGFGKIKSFKLYRTNNKDELFKIAKLLYGFEQNIHASYLFEYLNKDYSNDITFQTFRAVALSRLGKYSEAIQILNNYKEIAKRKKEQSDIYFAMANHYALANDKEKAVSCLRSAKKTYKAFNQCRAMVDNDFINLKDYPPFLEMLKGCNVIVF